MELSAEIASRITDRIVPEIKDWQSRLLNSVYPFVFMDCIHYKVREDGRILSRTAYIVLGITANGYKDMQKGPIIFSFLMLSENLGINTVRKKF